MFPYSIGDLCRAMNFEFVSNPARDKDICLVVGIKYLEYHTKFKLFNLRTQKTFWDVWHPDFYAKLEVK